MKNSIALSVALLLLLALVIGCSSVNPFSSRSKPGTTPSANALGDQRIGIPECDEVFDMMTEEANDPNDNYITKAAKALFFDTIREQIRKAVEDSKKGNSNVSDADLAKKCTEFKQQLIKYKAEQEQKKGK
ncbi:MAG: hypothetical protein JO053_09675 [Acidobacteria bacterium]|nr:hypothetical protein [Acidobacteriota bacterium]